MMTKIKLTLGVSAMLLFFVAFAVMPAYASGWGDDDNDDTQSQDQDQHQGQNQHQGQGQAQGQIATGGDGGDATINIGTGGEGGVDGQSSSGNQGALSSNASNDGVTVEGDTSNVENNSSNVVLVPNNNTEGCLRVWGIAWGKDGSSGALGVPWRSTPCDLEAAADDAFAAGERELGWYWKCQNKNLYKQFKDKGESADDASRQCLDRMLGGVTSTQTITSLTEQVEQMMAKSTRQSELYKEQSELIAESCSDANERMHAMCQAK